MLPLRRQITEQTQLQFNAMQVGAFQLLQAKRDEVEAGVAYIESLRDYWMARGDLNQITSGRMADSGQAAMTFTTSASSGSTGGRRAGGH
jgi:cobalt-zinc-cadmium efflux system outer membrane protein